MLYIKLLKFILYFQTGVAAADEGVDSAFVAFTAIATSRFPEKRSENFIFSHTGE